VWALPFMSTVREKVPQLACLIRIGNFSSPSSQTKVALKTAPVILRAYTSRLRNSPMQRVQWMDLWLDRVRRPTSLYYIRLRIKSQLKFTKTEFSIPNHSAHPLMVWNWRIEALVASKIPQSCCLEHQANSLRKVVQRFPCIHTCYRDKLVRIQTQGKISLISLPLHLNTWGSRPTTLNRRMKQCTSIS
jgi:hypothetical protein